MTQTKHKKTEAWAAYEFDSNWFVGSTQDDSGAIIVVKGDHDKREERAKLIATLFNERNK